MWHAETIIAELLLTSPFPSLLVVGLLLVLAAMGLNEFISDTLGLTKLPPHLPTLTIAVLAFLIIHQVLAPWGSRRWFPEAYSTKSRRARNNWCVPHASIDLAIFR